MAVTAETGFTQMIQENKHNLPETTNEIKDSIKRQNSFSRALTDNTNSAKVHYCTATSQHQSTLLKLVSKLVDFML